MTYVAPCVGAWIETLNSSIFIFLFKSRPAWARGLKPTDGDIYIIECSRALRGRVD